MTRTGSDALIVQSDGSLLLDVHAQGSEEARSEISVFAELEKSPEHMHTYRMTPLSLWNAASAGVSAREVLAALERHARYAVPENVAFTVTDTISRYGMLKLTETDDPHTLRLEVVNSGLREELLHQKRVANLLRVDEEGEFTLSLFDRGSLKQELTRIGYPVEDLAPLEEGEHQPVSFRRQTLSGDEFVLRDYQREAAETFYGEGRRGNGFGTVVLPCGAGKTVVGIAAMELLQTNTLIVTTNVAAVHQWIDELKDKTSLGDQEIGEYTGDRKQISPITVATYQILVWRASREEDFPHFELFRSRRWGLIIYDEVHLVPAPMFRVTAELQAVRRLGLTATLVREDGHEEDVFSLVGPKRYDVPWKELERKGWIAEANCYELRLDLPESKRVEYAVADKRGKFRISSENPAKLEVVRQLVDNHREDAIMVIGQYLDQLMEVAQLLDAPLITGKTPNKRREEIYGAFRRGQLRVIVVSKVANFAIDLPDASMAIQISGTFGSRQEEAQRLGRILRPKKNRNSYFYTLVTRMSVEESFAANRQKFLTEQGYKYHIEYWRE
ncbi:MAG: DNA repair helicase XPB [Alkalispirochaetaceae bacterium]